MDINAVPDLLRRVEAALGSAACVLEKFRNSGTYGRMWTGHQERDYSEVKRVWDEVHNIVAGLPSNSTETRQTGAVERAPSPAGSGGSVSVPADGQGDGDG